MQYDCVGGYLKGDVIRQNTIPAGVPQTSLSTDPSPWGWEGRSQRRAGELCSNASALVLLSLLHKKSF